jgi:hypothetical protein
VDYHPRFYRGKVEDYIRRDGGPYYVHTVTTPSGISGGPLVRVRTGLVHGVLCRSIQLDDGSYVFNQALDVSSFVSDWAVPVLGGLTLRSYAEEHPRRVDVR